MHTKRLRLVLQANGAFSVVAGLIGLVAGSWVSRELGIDHVVLTRLLGVGLIGFGADVIHLSRASEPRLLRDSLLVSIADVAWVIATALVVATGVLTTAGNVVAVVQGLAVADFGAAQLLFGSQARQAARTEGTATVAV